MEGAESLSFCLRMQMRALHVAPYTQSACESTRSAGAFWFAALASSTVAHDARLGHNLLACRGNDSSSARPSDSGEHGLFQHVGIMTCWCQNAELLDCRKATRRQRRGRAQSAPVFYLVSELNSRLVDFRPLWLSAIRQSRVPTSRLLAINTSLYRHVG